MQEFLSTLRELFVGFNFTDAVDIALVAFLNYRILLLVRGTRALQLVIGVVGFVILLIFSDVLRLGTLHWILDKAALLAPVALVILLLPELRHMLEGIGRFGIGPGAIVVGANLEPKAEAKTIEEIIAAAAELAASRIGALIVIEKGGPLENIVANGVLIEAKVSAPLLNSIFYEGNPLHDGAVIIRDDRIIAAACRLPLSESSWLDQNLHMRHRAGIGVTEQNQCIAVIVSEERGTISLAADGRLKRVQNPSELRELLNGHLRKTKPEKTKTSRALRLKKEVAPVTVPQEDLGDEARSGQNPVEPETEILDPENMPKPKPEVVS